MVEKRFQEAQVLTVVVTGYENSVYHFGFLVYDGIGCVMKIQGFE